MAGRYQLEKYNGIKSRHTCPACGKPKQFTRYKDVETGAYLADHVGICNRVVKCGYRYAPSTYLRDNPAHQAPTGTSVKYLAPAHRASQPCIPMDTIPWETVEKTLSHYPLNNFITYLHKHCGAALTQKACKRFLIGTAKHWPGATIFWQIDQQKRVRTGKIMLYDACTGKRIKQPDNLITWVHKLQKVATNNNQQLVAQKATFNLEQCLFGLHQLIGLSTNNVVVIVESEKTAIVASMYFPDYTWMACGGIKNLNSNKLLPLKDFPIVLYPDINAYQEWEAKATQLRSNGFRIQVSTLLEKLPDMDNCIKLDGFDLADFLLLQPPPKSALEKLIDKNPLLQQLVDRLDLVQQNAF